MRGSARQAVFVRYFIQVLFLDDLSYDLTVRQTRSGTTTHKNAEQSVGWLGKK